MNSLFAYVVTFWGQFKTAEEQQGYGDLGERCGPWTLYWWMNITTRCSVYFYFSISSMIVYQYAIRTNLTVHLFILIQMEQSLFFDTELNSEENWLLSMPAEVKLYVMYKWKNFDGGSLIRFSRISLNQSLHQFLTYLIQMSPEHELTL